MRFLHGDFNDALKAATAMMDTTDYYVNSFDNNLLVIPFEKIMKKSPDAINNICNFLELSVPENEKLNIMQKFSRTKVKKNLNKLANVKIIDGVLERENDSDRYETVENFDGTYRVFDKHTSFQSNHITSKRDGEWKECFTKDQLSKLNILTEKWLLRYKYKI